MRKVLHLLKVYKLLIIGLALGVVISFLSVYYAAPIYYNGQNVSYNNQTSGMTSTNVKDALDEIYTKANSNQIIKKFTATTNDKPGIITTGTYTSCGGSNYTCSSRTIDYNVTITGDFEIGFDSWFYNQTNALMGGHYIIFKNGNTEVFKIQLYDAWNSYNRIRRTIAVNGTTLFSEDSIYDPNVSIFGYCGMPNVGNTSYRIIRSSEMNGDGISLYECQKGIGDGLSGNLGSFISSLPETFTITSIEVHFIKYTGYQIMPSAVSNIYIGPIRS